MSQNKPAPHTGALEAYGYLLLIPGCLLGVGLFVSGSYLGALACVFGALLSCRLLRAASTALQAVVDIRHSVLRQESQLAALADISDESRTILSQVVPPHPANEN